MTKRLHASLTSPLINIISPRTVPLFIDCQLIGFRCRGIDEFATTTTTTTTTRRRTLFAAPAAKTLKRLQSPSPRGEGARLEAFALYALKEPRCVNRVNYFAVAAALHLPRKLLRPLYALSALRSNGRGLVDDNKFLHLPLSSDIIRRTERTTGLNHVALATDCGP